MEKYVEFKGISKLYPGVRALKEVSFRAEGGKVTALIGENGAGKSTLLRILSGDAQPDEGQIIINGEEKKFANTNQALHASISVIYQERQLVPMLSVMENIFIDDLPANKLGVLNRTILKEKAQEILDDFGLPINPTELVGKLSIAYQQMVEIMKAIRRNSSVIAFDEPTSSLTDTEVNILFRVINKLKDEGKAILYVSHRIAEVFQITDDIVVLKDGALVKTFKTTETNESELIRAMVGRDTGEIYSNLSRNDKFGDTVLEVKGLTNDLIKDVSFSVRAGEILGFAGLIGAGRTEVMRAIFGADKLASGEILLKGEKVRFKTPREAIKHGVALCPEDRKEQGLVLNRSLADNITMLVLDKMKNGPFLSKKKETELAEEAVAKFNIKTPTTDKVVAELSGGNQQKVILGRWTSKMAHTDVLILDEPTKGIDVGTKADICQTVCDMAKEGKAVIFISSELTEVLNVCDNIMVMHNGHITGKLSRQEATEENVLALAMLE